MKTILFIFFTFYFSLLPLLSQPSITWQRTYGGPNVDEGHSIVQTPDSGYIAVGAYFFALYVMKLNVYGDTIWSQRLNMMGKGRDVEKTSDGNYVVCTNSSFVVKISITGDTIWTYRPHSNRLHTNSIKQTIDGGYILCGVNDSSPSPYTISPYLLKLDQMGRFQWDTTYYRGIFNGGINDITLLNDGNMVMVGHYADTNISREKLFILKTDSVGNYIWFKPYDTLIYHYPHTIINTNFNGYIVGGRAEYPFILKVNEIGDIIWFKKYNNGNPSMSVSNELTNTYDGGYAFTGFWDSAGNFNSHMFLLKTDSLGNEEWHKSFGFNDNDRGWGIKQTVDSGYIIIGERGRYNFDDIYIVKTDKTGHAEPYIGVGPSGNSVPIVFELYQNFPNPFNPITNISYELSANVQVILEVYDILGKEVSVLVNQLQKAGKYTVRFNGTNLASGMYFYRLTVDGVLVTAKKMIILK